MQTFCTFAQRHEGSSQMHIMYQYASLTNIDIVRHARNLAPQFAGVARIVLGASTRHFSESSMPERRLILEVAMAISRSIGKKPT